MATSDRLQPQLELHQRIVMRDKPDYIPVGVREEDKDFSSNSSSDDNNDDTTAIENFDDDIIVSTAAEDTSNFGIDHDAVDELQGDIKELRKGLLGLLLLFVLITGVVALDDYYSYKTMTNNVDDLHLRQPPHPHRGHKLQINASAFTVNDYECLQLDTKNWPSERVHCELRPSKQETVHGGDGDGNDDVARYDFVVEHFDDEHCQEPNAENPIVRHTTSGCFFFEGYNHSYNDLCHMNRTLTVSAFYGPGCLHPMPVTAVNVAPEEGEQ
jgi:hypothetical protein